MDRRRDDLAVEDDREPLAVMRLGVVVEQVGTVLLELDVHRQAGRSGSVPGRAALIWSPLKMGVGSMPVGQGLALGDGVRVLAGDAHEVEPAGGAHELPDLLGIRGTRQLDGDAVATLGLDVGLATRRSS